MTVASSVLGPIYDIATAGLAGIGLLAFFFRWIVPGGALDDVKAERDQWRALYEQERQAHQATVAAYTAASQRSDAGVEAGRVTLAIVEALRGTSPPTAGPAGTSQPGA